MSAGLYLRGDALNPAEITDLLKTEPTSSHVKGEIVVGTAMGRTYAPKKTGVWSLVVDHDGPDVEEVVVRVLARLDHVECDVSALPNVTEAEFDIFAAAESGPVDGNTCELNLSAEHLARLAELKISVSITVAIIRAES